MPVDVKFRITGHRVNQAAFTPEKFTSFQPAVNELAQHLSSVVGSLVYERIASGAWHTSTNPEYQEFRAYLAANGLTSRSRRRSFRRLRGAVKARPVTSNYRRSFGTTRDQLKFNFLMRVFQKAEPDESGSVTFGSARKRSKRSLSSVLSETSNVYDVDSALRAYNRMRKRYRQLWNMNTDNSREEARKLQQKFVHDFLHGKTGANRLLTETRMGQRLLKQADLAAARFNKSTGVYVSDDAVASGRMSRYAKQLADVTLGRTSITPKASGRMGGFAGGAFKFGYQTGSFAKAWQNAGFELEQNGLSLRLNIVPSEVNQGNLPNLKLTHVLKRIITRQRGNPNLLGKSDARKAARESLELVQGTWAARGIRIKNLG